MSAETQRPDPAMAGVLMFLLLLLLLPVVAVAGVGLGVSEKRRKPLEQERVCTVLRSQKKWWAPWASSDGATLEPTCLVCSYADSNFTDNFAHSNTSDLEQSEDVDAQRRRAALMEYAKAHAECFPEVPDISSEELMELVRRKAVGGTVVLVDCRSDLERKVSIYEGALTTAEFESKVDKYKDKLIVTYCAIGRRAGFFAQKLLETYPHMKVRNHAGSLVDWAHVGGPLIDNSTGTLTNRIHSNGIWAPYLPLTRKLHVVN